MDPLDGVTVFLTVVRFGSFSAAAEALGCSKSTTSEAVSRLERRVGARLLRRSTRAVSLTEAGRAYLSEIDGLLDRVREAERAARAEAGEPRGVLRLSAPSAFAALHLAPILPEFLRRHPEVRIDLHATAEVVDLVAGGFDRAIRLCPRNGPSMIVRRLGGTRVVAVAAPSLLAGRLPLDPEELAGWPALANAVYPDQEVWRLERGAERRMVPVSPRVSTACSETLLALARAGAGIGQFGHYQIAGDLRAGRLVRLCPDWSVVDVPVLAVYPDNRQIAAKVRAFVDFLARRLPVELRAGSPAEGDRACPPSSVPGAAA
jgi:DNA-binding transcriptional LysR family regulator